MISVVIAAHNEEAVIGRCLDALLAGVDRRKLDVIVSANGCTDQTVAEARARGVRVVEIDEASKALALNAADEGPMKFPRVYLDADMVVSFDEVQSVTAALSDGPKGGNRLAPVLAAVPARRIEVAGRPWLVQAYFAIGGRLPAFEEGLFGRGMIALNAEGRARFEHFPVMVADDLFLDSLFSPDEKRCVTTVATTVAAPLRTKDLVRRLVRVRRGNAAMRAAAQCGDVSSQVRPADRTAWLREVVRAEPRLAPASVAYVGLTVVAAVLARRGQRGDLAWQRDESTRRIAGPTKNEVTQ